MRFVLPFLLAACAAGPEPYTPPHVTEAPGVASFARVLECDTDRAVLSVSIPDGAIWQATEIVGALTMQRPDAHLSASGAVQVSCDGADFVEVRWLAPALVD